jgi:hypothetical protein
MQLMSNEKPSDWASQESTIVIPSDKLEGEMMHMELPVLVDI